MRQRNGGESTYKFYVMEANQLRIGNWYISVKFGVPVRCEMFEPIPLTEEWMLKFGFEKHDFYYAINWGINGVLIMKYLVPYSLFAMELGIGFKKTLQYVHQLQNLYFDLTGEELTINDNGKI